MRGKLLRLVLNSTQEEACVSVCPYVTNKYKATHYVGSCVFVNMCMK